MATKIKNKKKKKQETESGKSRLSRDKKNIGAKIDACFLKIKEKTKKRKAIKYIATAIVLLLLVWVLFCLKAQSVSRGYSTFISTINEKEKEMETERADAAKEELLKKANYSMEDFNLKIKDTDFEKLSFEKNIPILMYHYIEPESPTQSRLRRDLGVTPENFDKQMKWLYDNGFKTLTVSKFFSFVAEQKEILPKTVLLTFDDGYRDFFENAAPILNRYNMTATIFIIADSVGYPAYMDWDQVKQLSDQGFEFGSHSLTHPNLRNTGNDGLKNEVLSSKKKIEDEISKNVNFFCYPTGAFDDRVEKATREAGYRGAFTVINGYRVSNKNMFELPRFRITHTMSIDGFAWTVNSAQ